MCLAAETCPAGWTVFNSSCYFFSREAQSWVASWQSCRRAGADLVVIDTPEEQVSGVFSPTRWCVGGCLAGVWMVLILFCYAKQNFLVKNITGNTWIGLTDIETEGTWKWIDGNPLINGYLSPDYLFWATVENMLAPTAVEPRQCLL